MKKVLYIVNPISGIGKQKKVEEWLKKYNDHNQIKYTIQYTAYPGNATEISQKEAPNYQAIVAVGGDGSVNEVAHGLMGTQTALGIIPAGSGNGIARNLHLPMNLRSAIERINQMQTTVIDVGMANHKLFVNVAGIGFDAQVAHRFADHGSRGLTSYIKITLQEFRNLRPERYTIEIDGKLVNRKFVMMSIANGKQFGNNAFVAPQASMQDGAFDVVFLKKIPVLQVPALAGKLFLKRFHTSPLVDIIKAQKIVFRTKGEIPFQVDGEPAKTYDKVSFLCLTKKLTVIV